jgi:hypothetical protein
LIESLRKTSRFLDERYFIEKEDYHLWGADDEPPPLDEYADDLRRLAALLEVGSRAFYVFLYLAAIVAANLLVARFGPWISVVNAFLFIGLDLTTRDKLHDAWQGRALWPKMALLVGAGSALSWLLNRDAGRIAMASFAAFALAGVADTVIYHLLRERAKMLRVNGSNVASAAVDSVAFPALAFGFPLRLDIMLLQFAAKVGGGYIWSWVLFRDWLDFCYAVRKAWIVLNPTLPHKSKRRPDGYWDISPDAVQWIARRAPLKDRGVWFFQEGKKP